MLHAYLTLTILLVAACAEGRTKAPSPSVTEEREVAPEPAEPRPVYTSAVCCTTGLTCALGDGARPLGTTCACSNPEGVLQGRVC